MSNSLRKRILAALTAGVMFFSVPMMSGCNNESEGGGESSEASKTEVSESSTTSKLGGNIAAKSQSYKISLPIMQYLFNYNYQRYVSTYGQYLIYYGLDTSKSLKEQYYDEDNKETWYDFFLETTRAYMEQTLVQAEAAKAEGNKLSDEETSDIENNMTSLSSKAAEESVSVDDYIKKFYGEGVTEDEIKNILQITVLAKDYNDALINSYKYTDEEYEKYYEENKSNYLYADFLSFYFNYGTTDSSTGETSVDEKKKEEAKKNAEELAKCKTEDEFYDFVKKYLSEHPEMVSVTSESSESSITEEDFNEAVEKQAASVLSSMVKYEKNTPVGSWVFEDGHKVYDTKVVEGSNSYVAVMIVKPAYRDESVHRNVRHILIQSVDEDAPEDSEEDSRTDEEKAAAQQAADEKAMNKANEIYQEWKDGDATEDSFAALAAKYSEDPGSQSNGGLYTDVEEGYMVQPFNDWLFDENRKPGDTGIVKTSFGYHIMYYVGENGVTWKNSVDYQMRNESFSEDYKKLQAKYPVEFDDDYLKNIEVIELNSSDETASSEG